MLHGLGARGPSTRPTTSRPRFRIMQLPPLPEIPEPIRGRSDRDDRRRRPGRPGRARAAARARPGDRHVRDDARARARAPAPGPGGADAVRRRHRADRRAARRRRSRRCSPSPARAPARRWRSSSCARSAARWPARRPATARSAAIDAQFVLFTGGMALDAGHGARSCRRTWPSASRPRWRRGSGAGHYLNFAEEQVDASRHLRRRHLGAAAGRQGPPGPGQRDPREPRHLDSAPYGADLRAHRRPPARSGSPSSRCSSWAPPRRATTGTSTSRPRARSARCGCSTTTPSPTWTSSAAARRRSPTCARTGASA